MAKARVKGKTLNGFAEINHDAAGIDVGNAQHRVKTDRRDAEKLARCYRSGDLTAAWFRMKVRRLCGIWYVLAKQPNRI